MEEHKPDMLSSLPIELLHYIIGFLPFESARLTPFVSTRFRSVWNQALLVAHSHNGSIKDIFHAVSRFINNFDEHNPSKNTRKLELHVDKSTFVSTILAPHNVMHMSFFFSDGSTKEESFCWRLEINNQIPRPIDSSGYLVKTLCLDSLNMLTHEVVSSMVLEFSLLESLKICGSKGLTSLTIDSPTKLLHLSISGCPKLRYLDIRSIKLKTLHYQGFLPLIKIHEHFNLTNAIFDVRQGPNVYNNALDIDPLLLIIKNSQSLKLCRWMFEELIKPSISSSWRSFQFYKLQELRWIDNSMNQENINFLISFLKLCPSIERLFITKSALLLCGDYMEAYETMVPLYVLQSFGITVHCVSPNRTAGDRCVMSAHDFLGLELYTELEVDQLTLNANFDDVTPENYDVIIIPGGRFTEILSADEKCVDLVARFAESKKLIFTSCHSQIMLMAAGILAGGVKCTAFESMKPLIELSGGEWWQQPGIQSMFEITDCVKDGNFVSMVGWPTLGHGIRVLLESLGAKISNSKKNQASVLFLIGDYVEDYGINVPFRALQALGCKVDAVTPNKKKGEVCATAVYDLEEGRQIPAEKRGHNFFVTASWDDICVDDYDCVVVPGGRSPELLVMNEKAVALVNKFAEKDKVLAAIGQGKLLLAATGVLKGKRCASGKGMKVMVKVAGGEAVEAKGSVTDGKLVTAASATDLPALLSDLSTALGLTVMF